MLKFIFNLHIMKTLKLNNLLAACIVLAVVVFVTFAVIHIVHLTQAGLINWNN